MLESSYRAGETFGSAFGRLFSQIFAGTGLILMQPLDKDVHAIAKPLLRTALEGAEELDRELLRRGKELQDAGYHEQVKVTGSSTLLFILQDGERSVMQIAGDDFLVRAQRLPRAEVFERLEEHPEQFSPNVLLRPVIQDYLLPTVVYFGGPSEIAYFAQAAVVYQNLLGRVTPVLPRLSLTVVNSRMQRLLRRYDLQLPELFRGETSLRELLAAGSSARRAAAIRAGRPDHRQADCAVHGALAETRPDAGGCRREGGTQDASSGQSPGGQGGACRVAQERAVVARGGRADERSVSGKYLAGADHSRHFSAGRKRHGSAGEAGRDRR